MVHVKEYLLSDWTQPEHFEAYRMESDEDWLEFRNKGVGGSEVSAIMGITKYRTPVEVWMEKTGRKEPTDLSDKEAVEWGNRLEAIIREKFAEMHPELTVDEGDATFVSKERPWAHANLDGMVRSIDGEWGILEIKTVGKNRERDWADGVPDYYMTQVTHYLSVTGWSYAWVAALIGGQHYVEYRVERDEEDIAMVNAAVDTFWQECVIGGNLPEVVGTQGEAKAIMDIFGIGSDEYAAPDDVSYFDSLVSDYQEARACERQYAERAKKISNDLRAMAGSRRGIISDVYRVTWAKSESTRFDKKRFAEENPDLIAEYTTTYMRDGGLKVSEVK